MINLSLSLLLGRFFARSLFWHDFFFGCLHRETVKLCVKLGLKGFECLGDFLANKIVELEVL